MSGPEAKPEVGAQVLTPYNLELKVPRPESIDSQSPVVVKLKIRQDNVEIGSVSFRGDFATLRVAYSIFRELSKKYPQGLAEMRFSQGAKDLSLASHFSAPVFIGGDFDWKCERPILFSDYDGTLSLGDSCTTQKIDDFIEAENVNVFVVSSRGTDVAADLEGQKFRNSRHFAVLDKMDSSSGNPSGEKGYRIAAKFMGAGACILGLAGDSPYTDGEAARTLGIPYLAANQKPTAPIVGYVKKERKQKKCVLKHPVSFELSRSQFTNCPEHWDSYRMTKYECFSADGKKFWSWEKSENPCEKFQAAPTGVQLEVEVCSTRLAPTVDPEWDDKGDGFDFFRPRRPGHCREPYEEKEVREQVDEPVFGKLGPSIDITTFPQGSLYSEDWCQLTEALSDQLKTMRSSAK